jgi:hypothetical protein
MGADFLFEMRIDLSHLLQMLLQNVIDTNTRQWITVLVPKQRAIIMLRQRQMIFR